MNDRTRQIWLPALAGIAATFLLPQLLIRSIWYTHMHLHLVLHRYAYLVIEPLVWALSAAIGVSLSRRAGGGRFARATCGFVLIAVMVAVTYNDFCRDSYWDWQTIYGLRWFIGSDALGLLLGTLPFLLPAAPSSAGAAHA